MMMALMHAIKEKFPGTLAFENEYWDCVSAHCEKLAGFRQTNLAALIIGNYLTGFLLGEGRTIEEVKTASEAMEELIKTIEESS